MTLDPEARKFLDQVAAANIQDVPHLSLHEARAQSEVGALMLGRPPKVERVDDQTFPGPAGPLRIRLTYPEGNGPFPALVYFHGGGWVVGSLATHDHLCRAITNAAGIAVASVDYRLAPENPFPAAVEDAEAATLWIAANAPSLGIDPARLAVGGDSAGATLATVVARRLLDRGGPPLALQLLLYPSTNANFNTPSYLENAEGCMLTRAAMQWYWNQYVPTPSDRLHPDASPLLAPSLANLPPAFLITAGHDPLRDEALAYATRLTQSGVPVQHSHYPGMIHGFLRRYSLFTQGKRALEELAQALTQALHP